MFTVFSKTKTNHDFFPPVQHGKKSKLRRHCMKLLKFNRNRSRKSSLLKGNEITEERVREYRKKEQLFKIYHYNEQKSRSLIYTSASNKYSVYRHNLQLTTYHLVHSSIDALMKTTYQRSLASADLSQMKTQVLKRNLWWALKNAASILSATWE